jgi:RimJ/RimL family protein N-acetyltransferase
LASLLTEAVTRPLPAPWQGNYTLDRARDWIRERDETGVTLLVSNKLAHRILGLMVLVETPVEPANLQIEVRLGYLLSEVNWGMGLASELVAGFVTWCRGQPVIRSIAGGVSRDNPASGRVLEKNGFHIIQCSQIDGMDELFYRLILHQ